MGGVNREGKTESIILKMDVECGVCMCAAMQFDECINYKGWVHGYKEGVSTYWYNQPYPKPKPVALDCLEYRLMILWNEYLGHPEED